MKATLEFDLPTERADYRNATYAGEMAQVISDLDQYLRNGLKYGGNTEEWRKPEELAGYIRREYLLEILNKLEC